MAAQVKIIVAVTLAHALLGVAWNALVVSRLGFVTAFHVANALLAVLGSAAAIGWLKGYRWSSPLLIAFYAVQLPYVLSPSYSWSSNLAFNSELTFGWHGMVKVGIDVFALVMLLWVGFRAFAPNNSSKPTPLRGAA